MKKTAEQLEREIQKLRNEIGKIEEAEYEQIQRPYLESLIGKCFVYRDNSYGSGSGKWDVYRKILALKQKEGSDYFIFEEFSQDSNDKISLILDEHFCYTHKNWFLQIPFTGFVKCSAKEYEKERKNIVHYFAI